MKVTKRGLGANADRPELGDASWGKDANGKRLPQGTSENDWESPGNAVFQEPSPEMVRRVRRGRSFGWEKGRRGKAPRGKALRRLNVFLLLVLLTLIGFGWRSLVTSAKTPVVPESVHRDLSMLALDKEFEALASDPVGGPLPHEVAMAFAKTSEVAARLKLCRDPGRIEALLPSFSEQAVSEIALSGLPRGEVIAEGLSIHRFELLFKGGYTRLLFVVRTDEGPKVDWESYARSCEPLQDWQNEARDPNFARGEESASVRVHVDRGHYYNFRFGSDDEWQSYQISSPDLEEGVTAYAREGTATAAVLERVISGKKRMTLQLRSRLDDARKQQFEIERVHAVGWVTTEGDFEKRWMASQAQDREFERRE